MNTIERQKKELKMLVDAKNTMRIRKDQVISDLNAKINELEKRITFFETSLEQKNENFIKLEKKCRQLVDEKEKLRQRIMAIKMKSSVNVNQKLCKNCSQEYEESQNFNWSCRTHRVIQNLLQSEYGEHMWWCCGKFSKEAPGCKYSKHISKEDGLDQDDAELSSYGDSMNIKKFKCLVYVLINQTCKELGHKIEDCPREPNIRTGKDGRMELDRIKCIKRAKKVMNDNDTFLPQQYYSRGKYTILISVKIPYKSTCTCWEKYNCQQWINIQVYTDE